MRGWLGVEWCSERIHRAAPAVVRPRKVWYAKPMQGMVHKAAQRCAAPVTGGVVRGCAKPTAT